MMTHGTKAGERREQMETPIKRLDVQNDHEMPPFEFSDETLEIAASATIGTAISFPGSPTVSVLVVCCSVDESHKLPPKLPPRK